MMPQNEWFVHLQGETFGPISSDLIRLMIKQNRLQFTDFIFKGGMTQWARISEVTEFTSLIPPFPSVPPPKDGVVPKRAAKVAEPEVEVDAEPAPAPAPTTAARAKTPVAPKAAPAPKKEPVKPKPKAPIRYSERVAIDAVVNIDGVGSFKAVNISETGILLKDSANIPKGEDLKFKLISTALEKPLDMTGILVREGETEFALEFTRVNPAHKRMLQKYVQSQQT